MLIEVKPSTEIVKVLTLPARGDIDLILNEIQSGVCQLWQGNAESSGYVVTRIEKHKDKMEFVLVLGVGQNMRPIVEYLCKFVDKMGMSFRTHVTRRGLIRIYQRYGFKVVEIRGEEFILKRAINGR